MNTTTKKNMKMIKHFNFFKNTKFQSVKRFRVQYSTVTSEYTTDTQFKQWQDIPGPTSFPIIGQVLHYIPGIGSLDISNEFEKQQYLYDNYGPVVRLEGFKLKKSLYLLDPEHIRQLYQNESKTPTRASFDAYRYYKKVYNKTEEEKNKLATLMTEEKERWRALRTAANSILLKPNLAKAYGHIIDDVSSDMVYRLKQIRDQNNTVQNIQTELGQWSLEALSSISLGGRIHGLNSNEDTPQRKLLEQIYESLSIIETLDINQRYGLWRYFNTPMFKKAMRIFKEHEEIARYFIKKANNDVRAGPKSLYQKLSENREEFALGLASDSLLAGVFSTSTTVTNVLYLLAIHPDKQNKLRSQLLKNDKKYLKAVIKETLRVMPLASKNKRCTTRDQIVGGYVIPEGTAVTLCHHFPCMQESQYPKAAEFIPERWIVEKNHPLYHGNAHPYSFMPFGEGIRMCIGKQIVHLETESLVSKLIKNFDISWDSNEKPIIVQKIVNFFENPDHFKFEDLEPVNF